MDINRNHLGHYRSCLYRFWTKEENPPCECPLFETEENESHIVRGYN